MTHKHNGMPELVWAALTFESPNPPPIDDAPPLHVFTLSIGMMIGKLQAQGKFRPQDSIAAANWLAGKNTVAEIIQLIWNR